MLGYGTGTGPPGDGVLHTSGTVAIEMPPLPLWHRLRPLMLIVTDIFLRWYLRSRRAPYVASPPGWRSTAAARSGVVALLLQARCTGPSPALRANAATDSETASDPDALPTSPHTDAGAVNRSACSKALPVRVIANPYSSAR